MSHPFQIYIQKSENNAILDMAICWYCPISEQYTLSFMCYSIRWHDHFVAKIVFLPENGANVSFKRFKPLVTLNSK